MPAPRTQSERRQWRGRCRAETWQVCHARGAHALRTACGCSTTEACRHGQRCQLVIHNNTENPQTSLSLDVGARWLRRRRTVATRREHNFLRLGAVELEVIRRRPCVQVLISAWHVSVLTPGTTRYVSSANLKILLHACTGCRSAAVTMYEAGPRAEP